jgi:outer membrane protein OmpA-like peptidoglycan-associated protein
MRSVLTKIKMGLASHSAPMPKARLQRKCACGGTPGSLGKSGECNRPSVQTKLTVNQPWDRYEREADQVAYEVARGGTSKRSSISSLSDGSAAREKAPEVVDEVLRSGGEPLDASTRHLMERGFGHNFGHVRVHTDVRAAESARAVDALAYTVGQHVAFQAGKFAPATAEGRKLLAHELTHVLQQQSIAQEIGPQLPIRAVLQRQPLGSGGLGGPDDEGALLWESYRQSITLAGFDSDSATLKSEHLATLKEYKERLQTLLGRYPDSFISVIGHTDATDTEAHNKALGQKRADAVLDELMSGDNALPATIIHAGSLGETALAVETKGREARNRRVEIIPQLRRFVKLPPPTPSQPWQPGGAGTTTEESEKGGGPESPPKKEDKPKTPDLKSSQKNWLEEALKKDPIIKSLPDWARDKVINALKDADEMLAQKAIDALPLDDKTKAAVQAVVKSLLQLAKGKKFKVPEAPPRQPDFGPAPKFPKMPGEVIIPGPTFRF